jgi:uncharacterized protein (TIGR04141 family)
MYLLRDSAVADRTSLRSKADIFEADLRDSAEHIAGVFILHGDPHKPTWLQDLGSVATIELEPADLLTRSLGAVVLVRANSRVIAVTFGTGFHAIEPSLIERGFGLRVTANMVGSNGIRGAQTRGVARSSRDQKTLLPVNGEFSDLSVEIDEDWLRQLSGKSSDTGFASAVSGADSLTLTIANFSMSNLGSKAIDVVTAWEGDEYKAKFPFLDQIVPIDKSDPLIEVLDSLADAQIRNRDPAISFAAPDPFEQLDVDHFEITCQYQRFKLADLETSAVLEVTQTLDAQKSPLENIRVYALNENDENIDRAYTLKSYIQTEVIHDGANYLLSAGLWFALRNDFVAEIDAQLQSIEDLSETLNLPTWDAESLRDDPSDKTAEGSYNIMVAEDRGYSNLDKKLVYFGRYEKLEICDLLTPDFHLLCVKTASDSPTLSHLVAQAVNSADAWGDDKYQSRLTEAWSTLSEAPLPDRGNAKFVLAIATAKPGRLADTLFFFSKVQIVNGYRQITRGQFSFAVARIPMNPIEPEKKERAPRGPRFV